MKELQFIDYGGLSRLDWFGVSREELFPEEAEEEQRLNGRFKKFKSMDEIPDENTDHHPDFEQDFDHWSGDELDRDDVFYLDEIDDLVYAFGDQIDDELAELAFMKDILQQEEKEEIDKKSALANFTPFSKDKIKREAHGRPYSKKGRKKNFDIHFHSGDEIKKITVQSLDRGRMFKAKTKSFSL